MLGLSFLTPHTRRATCRYLRIFLFLLSLITEVTWIVVRFRSVAFPQWQGRKRHGQRLDFQYTLAENLIQRGVEMSLSRVEGDRSKVPYLPKKPGPTRRPEHCLERQSSSRPCNLCYAQRTGSKKEKRSGCRYGSVRCNQCGILCKNCLDDKVHHKLKCS